MVRARGLLAARQLDGDDTTAGQEQLRDACFHLHQADAEARILGVDPGELEAALDPLTRGLLHAARRWLAFVIDRADEERTPAWSAALVAVEQALFHAVPGDDDEEEE